MKFDYSLYPGRVIKKSDKVNKIDKPIISIITPFFNSGKYIEQTAKSVLNQTYPYFEWIIVDDGSKDKESLEKLKEIEKMDERITVYHKENAGLAHTRDFGAERANKDSEYLVFLDDDDLINETFLECAYWTLETNKKASWAYVDTVNFDGQEYLWKKWFMAENEVQDNQLVAMAMIRKKDFFKVNGYEIREKAVNEDWNFWLKMLAKGMYPVRMSFLGFWYRRKPKDESELSRSLANRENAMKYINETKKQIKKYVEAVQYPKQDYRWDGIVEKVESIVVPKKEPNEKTKILMIVPWMVTGGADKFNLDLVSKLDKEKFEITLLTTEPNTNEWRQLFEEHIHVYDLTTFLDKKYWTSFVNYIIEKNNIDIIFNTNSRFGYSILPYLKAKYPEKPIMDYIHMEEWYNRNGGFSRDSSAISSVIDKTYVCNQNSEKILVNHFERNPKEVGTVYIGVDEKKFDPDKYNKKQILEKYEIEPDGKYIISYIARIDLQKRPHLLMQIMNQLSQIRNDYILLVAGDGPMLQDIKKEAQKLGIENTIKFLGNIKETTDIYTMSDMTLNCSIKEGLALTAYESLSMGVPVVSSDVGGQKELINEEVGVIVPCMQDETQIMEFTYTDEEITNYVEAIDKVLNNLQYYKENARKRVLKSFTIDSMVENMSKIFIDLKENPNKEKIQYGKNLASMVDITKELTNNYFIAAQNEYEWLCNRFNELYISPWYKDIIGRNHMGKKQRVKILLGNIAKKLHVYNLLRRILRRGDKE